MEEFRFNPFKERICVVLGKQPHESVTYFEFVSNLAMFSTHASTAEKLRLLFRMYDSDGDGSISHEDLSSVLLLTFGDHLDADTLGEIVDKTFSQLHTAVPGHLSFSEFAGTHSEERGSPSHARECRCVSAREHAICRKNARRVCGCTGLHVWRDRDRDT